MELIFAKGPLISPQRTIAFMKELSRIIPNSEPMWRRNASIKKTVKQAVQKGFTDIVVINEDNRIPNGMLISHLPDGPTANFRLSNVKITKDIKVSFVSTSRLFWSVLMTKIILHCRKTGDKSLRTALRSF